ncbi:ArsR/SmtB family transcription factor [Aquimarina algicola]|uniref:Helix-turn-helix transcriptional regulator n=1 Tax=Aquimarina algicola TaxID=2589995 RepID=A0A504J3G7_9FLAO|nr:metalloregulator ArsR/SmtB family transcription factor [Aquimarina algicola]TPN82982.1 helix-turn-helix transcriptional regulator [Aquimarina algicola]
MREDLTSFQVLDKSAEILKVIAHPIRLAIIELLFKKGESSVTDIYQILEVEQSVASYHLKNLRMVNVVLSKREGTKIYYSIENKNVIEIFHHISNLGSN